MRLTALRNALAHPLTAGCDLDDPATTVRRREIIRGKPFLRRIYEEWYDDIVTALADVDGPVLELGSGAGFLQERLPGVIASDVFPIKGLHLAADATALPFRAHCLGGIVMINVLHHIADVPAFLRDAARAVRPGGRLVLIEPWVSTWASLVYGHLHHEPYLPQAADWVFPTTGPLSGANSALPWIVFARDRQRLQAQFPEWAVVSVDGRMPLRYLLSGGVSTRSLVPRWTFALFRWIDRRLEKYDSTFPMFARIVLCRQRQGAVTAV
jgi:SAM-dependent methyltransferase